MITGRSATKCSAGPQRSRGFRLLRSIRSHLASERGQALAEFAIVIPILLVIVLGILDIGQAVNNWNDETHVANLAARAAAVGSLPTTGNCALGQQFDNENPQTVTDLVSFVKCELYTDSHRLVNGGGSTGPSALNVCVYVPSDYMANPEAVHVQISTTYTWVPFLNFIPKPTIVGAADQQIENPTSKQATWATTTQPC